MAPSLSEFGSIARGLARNPLGIIALFIVLVYAIAGIVLGATAEHLETPERLPVIYFLVLFPLVVLVAFYRLVANHHRKLYAPSDYKDESNFMRQMTPTEVDAKLRREVAELARNEADERQRPEPSLAPLQEATAVSDVVPVPPDAPVGLQKRIPRLEERGDVRARYVAAEELALRAVRAEFGGQIHRDVFTTGGSADAAIALPDGEVILVEVKLVRTKLSLHRATLQAAQLLARMYDASPGPRLLLVVVLDGMELDEGVRTVVRQAVPESHSSVMDFRVYTFAELVHG